MKRPVFNPFAHLPRPRLTGANLFNAAGALVALYLLVVLGQTIKHNYDLGVQVSQLQTQISHLQSQKTTLQSSIQYEQTGSFANRQARSQLGLQEPGEHVVIIPEHGPAPTPAATTDTSATQPQSNLQQWLSFLSGHDALH